MERAQLSIEWLQSARLDRNWTQEYVAERVGVEVMTIRRWERGQNKPQPRQYYQLCKLFQKALPPGLQAGHEEGRDGQAPVREEGQLLLADEVADACTRFQASDLTVRLLRILWAWPFRDSNARYHELQSLIMQEVEQKDNSMHDNPINRRNALRRIAVLPIEVYGLSLVAMTPLRSPEELLTQCAAGITACWYLRKGKDLAFASDVVVRYIPTLKEITANGRGAQRNDAAELLVQCLLLKSTLSRHLDGSNAAISYAQQAETYSRVAGSRMLQVLSLRTLAAIYSYGNQWEHALSTAKEAEHYLQEKQDYSIPHLVHSYVYAGLATYQSYTGKKQEALISLGKAHEMFSNQLPDQSIPIWIDHNKANLILNDGMTHHHLGLQKEALQSLSQIKDIEERSESIYVESLINQVIAEVGRDDQDRDMEKCIQCWVGGIEGAKLLQSNQRLNEAVVAYAAMRAAWPGEQRIKKLREQIIHW